jgi:hypothetical protein
MVQNKFLMRKKDKCELDKECFIACCKVQLWGKKILNFYFVVV